MNTLYLLDTNVLLLALLEPKNLTLAVQDTLSSPDNTILFSAASIWEIAIKQSLGKTNFDFEPENITTLALQTGFEELPVQASHSRLVAGLPWHHRDPFDRLLVAQAMALPAHLLTTDTALLAYSPLVVKI